MPQNDAVNGDHPSLPPGLARLHEEHVVLGASGPVRFRLEDGVIRVVALA